MELKVRSYINRLWRTRVGHRGRVLARDYDRRRCTVVVAVIDDELRRVRTRFVGDEGRRSRGGAVQRRCTARRLRSKCPGISQRQAVRVIRRAAVELSSRAHVYGLRRSGIGYWRRVLSRYRNRRGRAAIGTASHNQLNDVSAGLVGDEGGRSGSGAAQLRRAARRHGYERPRIGEWKPPGIGRAGAVNCTVAPMFTGCAGPALAVGVSGVPTPGVTEAV